jgi:glycosyltransferase involved in cell wall biosynthesis
VAKFLFCLPRFHTNAEPWVRILSGAGHCVQIDVLRVGATEDHRLIRPRVVATSPLTSRLARLLPRKADPDFYRTPGLLGYWREMARIAPDVVIVRGLSRWFMRVAALTAILQGRRLIIYDQDDPLPRRYSSTWLRRASLRMLGLRHVTARMAASVRERSPAFAETLPFGRPAADPQMLAPTVRRARKSPQILMVAKYRARKGHRALIAALADPIMPTNFCAVFCGEEADGADVACRAELEREVERQGLSDKVSFRANLDRAAMQQLYRESDIFVLPSVSEPAAVSPIEAAWNGCAALMDRSAGTRHYLPPEDRFVFDATDPHEIALKLAALVADPNLLDEARHACRNRVAAISSDAVILEKFQRMLPGRASRAS